jgi:hypothetical protein
MKVMLDECGQIALRFYRMKRSAVLETLGYGAVMESRCGFSTISPPSEELRHVQRR